MPGESARRKLRLGTLCRHSLKLERRLITGEVEDVQRLGIIYSLFPSKLIEAGQADNAVSEFPRNDFLPDLVGDMKIKFIFAVAHTACLAAEVC